MTTGTPGTGGSGGTINDKPTPSIANPRSFTFLNGNSGRTGSTANTYSYSNANVGIGGGGSTVTNTNGTATGGAGGAGAYIKIVYGPGQLTAGNVLSYFIGAGGTTGATDGKNGGIKITWT